jgi:hypothetical protein
MGKLVELDDERMVSSYAKWGLEFLKQPLTVVRHT